MPVSNIVPKKRKRGYGYEEDVNEAPQVVENEPVEVEQEVPDEPNLPIQSDLPTETPNMAAFEE
jgi:hypothetical protein